MLFNSIEFLLFFSFVILLNYIIPFKHRWKLLLASSYFFYMWWNPFYIVLILLSTIIDYYCAIEMDKKKSKKDKQLFLLLSGFVNIGLLFSFKYYNFFAEITEQILGLFINDLSLPTSTLLLPVGISFYTFQTLSYTIDVYRGKKQAEKHFGYFALFVTYFPQLVAGPIEKASVLIPQLKSDQSFDYYSITYGFRRMALGFFKKCVIADRLAITVDLVYNNPSDFTSLQLIIATFLFSYQIYCDFSGYSDIAIGSSKVLGITLQENFNRPFYSKSLTELWKKWHISIMQWFKDYVYTPVLFRNKRNLKSSMVLRRTIEAIFCVFIFSGLWHGSALHYVVFGLITGTIVVLEMILSQNAQKITRKITNSRFRLVFNVLQMLYVIITFSFCIVMFRADSVKNALLIWNKMITGFSLSQLISIDSLKVMLLEIISKNDFIIFVISFILLETIQLLQYKYDIYTDLLKNKHIVIRFIFYYVALGYLIYFSIYEKSQFIYFQF